MTRLLQGCINHIIYFPFSPYHFSAQALEMEERKSLAYIFALISLREMPSNESYNTGDLCVSTNVYISNCSSVSEWFHICIELILINQMEVLL